MTAYNLDHFEELRRQDELNKVKRLLVECKDDRKEFKQKLDDMRIANWKVAFADLNRKHSIETVSLDKDIQTKGFSVNRSQSIASGHYGEIYTAYHVSDTSKLYTCKMLMYKVFIEHKQLHKRKLHLMCIPINLFRNTQRRTKSKTLVVMQDFLIRSLIRKYCT